MQAANNKNDPVQAKGIPSLTNSRGGGSFYHFYNFVLHMYVLAYQSAFFN